MSTNSEALEAWCRSALGDGEFSRDHSWGHGEAVVREFSTSDRIVIVKAHQQRDKFEAELHAYRTWVPVLGDSAPALLMSDDSLQALVLSRLPGVAAPPSTGETELDMYRRAGRLLARFHTSAPAVELLGFAESQQKRLRTWIARARAGLVHQAEVSVVTQVVARLGTLPSVSGVPCHRDWQPRNWMVDDDGEVRVIDFEHARVAPWTDDLTRLSWNEWRGRPELRRAFLHGYGRLLSKVDMVLLDASSAIGHLATIVWADEHGDVAFGQHARDAIAVMAGGAH
jgi:aminoglycoside/choline kinase family phosphotransferase